MRLPVLVLALLLASHAAAEPARGDLTLDAPARDVAMAGGGGYLALGIEDARDGLLTDKDLNTWFLHETKSPYNTTQSGGADPGACEGPIAVDMDDCDSDAAFVAVSRSGDRMVVASQASSDKVVLVFINRFSGEKARETVSGVIKGLAMDDQGDNVAAAFDLLETPGVDDVVRLWDGDARLMWTHTVSGTPTALDISGDGQRVIVAAGSRVYIMPKLSSGSILTDNWSPRTVQAVAFSGRGDHLAAAADDRGTVRIYANERRILNVPGGQVGATAIDFSPDGSQLAIALGSTLRIWRMLDEPIQFGQVLLEENHGAAIQSLQHTGGYLAVASARDVAMYDADASVRLWKASVPNDIAAISMDERGDRLAVAFDSTLRLYEMRDAASLSLKGLATAKPGQPHELVLEVANSGDRLLAGDIQVDAPAAIGVDVEAAIRLLPGEKEEIPIQLTIPASWPPGDLSIGVDVQGHKAEKVLQVAEREAWSLTSDGATSRAIEDGSATFTLKVHNDGNLQGKAPLQTSVSPAQWTLQVLSGTDEVAPGAEAEVRIRLQAPAGAANLDRGVVHVGLPGKLPIELVGTVGARFQPGIEVPSRTQVTPGEAKEVQVTLRNHGNARDSFEVAIRGVPSGWAVTFPGGSTEQTIRDVRAGGSQAVTLVVEAPEGLTPITYVSTLEATSLGDRDETASAQIQFSPEEPKQKDSPGVGILLVFALAALARQRRD